MKVGITSAKVEKLYENGARFNALLWYDFFKNCGFNVTFLTNENVDNSESKNTFQNFKFLNYTNIWDMEKIKPEYLKKYPELFDFDVLFVIGLHDATYLNLIHQHGVKIIYVMLGSTYHNDVHAITEYNTFLTSAVENNYDEIWISPHFKYCQEYYKIRYKTENVFICPYFWRDDLMKNVKDKILKDVDQLKVAVVEPNIEQAKNCIIPFSICEKAERYIKKILLFNTVHIKDTTFFNKLLTTSESFKKGKVTSEGRHPLSLILSEYCNCVVSYVEDCDLNYVAIECFYLGVPLIHNSCMLKDYGYYYPRLNVSKGAEQIVNVIKNHDRAKYIEKHRPLIEKYSVSNPLYIAWVKDKLQGKINFDCEI